MQLIINIYNNNEGENYTISAAATEAKTVAVEL